MNRRLATRIVCLMIPLAASCASGDQGVDEVAGGSSAQSAVSTSELGTLSDPSVQAKLRDMGVRAASANGISSPRIVAVASPDQQAAEAVVSGDLIPFHAAVYVVVVTGGTFTAGRHPPGVPAPQGSVLTLTVDAATYAVLGVGIVDAVPDLSKISSDIVDLSPAVP